LLFPSGMRLHHAFAEPIASPAQTPQSSTEPGEQSTQRPRWFSRIPVGRVAELALAALLFGVALLLRYPNFMTIPPLTDEFKEVGWAMGMLEKHRWTLVAVDAYDGPLFAYLLAFLFRVLGYNMYLPRAFVLVVGSLTVVTTFFLAKELARGDRRVGLIAASLLAVNAHHILFNSHVAWSNDTTPFFATLAILAYLHATRRNHPRLLIVAGLLYGLAVQTHPSALALALPFLLDFSLARSTRAWLTSVTPYLAGATALAAYSPVLYYNLSSGFRSFQSANEAAYAFEHTPTLQKSLTHIAPLLSAIMSVALGTFRATYWDSVTGGLSLIAFWVVTLIALIWWARHGERFPLIAVSVGALFLAVFNRFYTIPDSGRYFQFLLPLIFATWAQVGFRACEWAGNQSRAVKLGRLGLLIAWVVLLATPLLALRDYYADANASDRNNVAMLAIVEAVQDERDQPVLVDYRLGGLRTGRGGEIANDLIYLLRLNGQAYGLVSIGDANAINNLRNYLRVHARAYLISFAQAPDALGPDFRLQPMRLTHFPCPSCPVPSDFGLFRWEQPR
jgi:4-amino-4-deoxy-L-arabinose transferase-like glycosyltransferase